MYWTQTGLFSEKKTGKVYSLLLPALVFRLQEWEEQYIHLERRQLINPISFYFPLRGQECQKNLRLSSRNRSSGRKSSLWKITLISQNLDKRGDISKAPFPLSYSPPLDTSSNREKPLLTEKNHLSVCQRPLNCPPSNRRIGGMERITNRR